MGNIVAKANGKNEVVLFEDNQEGSGMEIQRLYGVPVFVTLLDHTPGKDAVLDIYHDGILISEEGQMFMTLAEGEQKAVQTEVVNDVTIRHERG